MLTVDTAIAPHWRADIMQRLAQTETTHHVRIIAAIESGSRAWGFASPNSDYDVRFVYVRPVDWYLTINVENRRDVIEYPIVDDIDLNGWDIRKALRLLWQSNPSIVEWIHSTIIYREQGNFLHQMRTALQQSYHPTKGIFHYRSMAKNNYREHFTNMGSTVKLKKYFYVLRALLAARWIELHQTPAPLAFQTLLSLLDDAALLNAIAALTERKHQATEGQLITPIPILNQFIEAELAHWETYQGMEAATHTHAAIDTLNALFQNIVQTESGVQYDRGAL